MALNPPNPPLAIGPDRHGRTLAIAGGMVVAAPPPYAIRLHCAKGVIEPGAVCAHTHLYSGLARYGMPPAMPAPASFLQILQRVWWKLDRALDAPSLRAAAMDYVARALLSGTTTLVDHHESPHMIEGSLEILADVCDELGVRALLCYGATERNAGVAEARRGLAECARVPDSPMRRGLVGLHASFTVSDETIRAAAQLAAELGTVMHVHVAEDAADVADAQARGYAGPLERLEQLGALPRGSILAHGVHLDGEQARHCGELGCWLVHNPRSNEGNGVGYALSLGSSDRVALGSDGWDADMTVEDQALARLAAAHGDAGTQGRLARGHALVAERFGTRPDALQPGAVGDVVIRQDGAVKYAVVGGRVVVAGGKLTTGHFDSIVADARHQAARLWQRMAALHE